MWRPDQEKFNQSFNINDVSYAYPESDTESLVDMSLEVRKEIALEYWVKVDQEKVL